jgi:hypothetical protein
MYRPTLLKRCKQLEKENFTKKDMRAKLLKLNPQAGRLLTSM